MIYKFVLIQDITVVEQTHMQVILLILVIPGPASV